MHIVQTKNLTKIFDKTVAVDRLNLNVNEGEIYGIVGPDGAGKTTTLRLLASIMDPTSGQATIDGKDTVIDAEAVKEEIGYMSQRFGLYQDLSVLENLTFYADIYGLSRQKRSDKIEQLLEFSQLGPFTHRLAGHLSGGMKQKLGLACALIHTPKVLLLDEPTNGVDPLSRHDFWRILYQLLKDKVTIVISTAYMDEAERCHQVGFIYKGSLLTTGSPQSLKSQFPGKVLEMKVENPRQVVSQLQSEFGEDRVTLFGNRIHVFTQNSPETLQIIQESIPEIKRDPSRIQEINPSLEDVFIALEGGLDGNS